MKIKVVDATERQLDYMVASAIGLNYTISRSGFVIIARQKQFTPTTNWKQGGLIIEREGISWHCGNKTNWHAYGYGSFENFSGPTPLIAAMRCFVASRLGEEVDVPEELT